MISLEAYTTVAPPHLPSPAEHTKHKILETFLSNLARMGNSGAKPLLFGTIKVTGADLYDEVCATTFGLSWLIGPACL